MFVLMRALIWSALFIGFVLLYVPARLTSRFGVTRSLTTPFEITGLVIGTMGGLIAVWCIVTFVTVGKGTPAPFDPPRRLVTRGPYRYVRNPMYIGAGMMVVGAAAVYHSWILIGYVAALFIVTHLFVTLYEEPTLRRTFGGDYADYCRHVRRWWPRLRPAPQRQRM